MNVLLVDDNDSCLHILTQALHFLPEAKSTCVLSACEAWWHLSNPEQPFDLLISDVNMPKVNGVHLIQRVRATRSLDNLRIILCSGAQDRKTIETFLPLGVSHYIVKPYKLAMMVDKIRQTMAAQR